MRLLLPALLIACGPVYVDAESPSTPRVVTESSSTADTASASPWDPSPPTTDLGAILTLGIQCALLEGNPQSAFERVSEDRWDLASGPAGTALKPELSACVDATSDNYLLWTADGEIEIQVAGLWHGMSPSAQPNRWLGIAEPVHTPGPACDEGLASLGLSWPVNLSVEVLDIQ